MDFADLLAKGKNTPVLCSDGAVGLLVEFPLGVTPADLAGLGVPGESDLRWIPMREFHRSGSALRQLGSPTHPMCLDLEGDAADVVLMRALLRDLWCTLQTQDRRGPEWLARWRET